MEQLSYSTLVPGEVALYLSKLQSLREMFEFQIHNATFFFRNNREIIIMHVVNENSKFLKEENIIIKKSDTGLVRNKMLCVVGDINIIYGRSHQRKETGK